MKYCLIGEKLGHSYSVEVHSAMGLDYSLRELQKSQLDEFIKDDSINGFNVTIPYKKDVLSYVDFYDKNVEATGVVNTVLKREGKLYGYNTDIGGMTYMLSRKNVSLHNKNVLILGSGGTSKTACALAKLQGAKSLKTVSRSGEINYENCYDLKDTEIIINTTPVGMFPNIYLKPVDLSRFSSLVAVFDCIYNPFTTELLAQAKELNLICSDGLPMLVEQALLAEDIWVGEKHDTSVSEKLIRSLRKSKSNLVLYGMPSCGKSTLGRLLAEELGRKFVDLDEYITKNQGRTPSQIISSDGEKTFREIESLAVSEVAKLNGTVISLGGGSVLNPLSVNALKKNGVLIYVKRNLDLLSVENRPLSATKGVEKIYKERKSIYESIGDAEIENNKAIKDALKEIIKVYEIACNKWC